VQIFQSYGKALEKYAKESCKVLVASDPSNTNCLACSRYAPKIPRRNFAALRRLDQNRATAQLANKLKVPARTVSNVVIWGNNSAPVVDTSNAVVTVDDVKTPIKVEEKCNEELTECIRQRCKAVLEARGSHCTMSVANAIKDCIRDWHFGTLEGEHVALAVYSDGLYYNIAKDIFYSFPVTCKNGTYSVVPDLKISDYARNLMKKI